MSSSQSQPAPQEPATQESAPPAPRRMLPQIWRHSIWRPDAGLIVSPTSRILPSEVVSQKGSTKMHDFSKPRLLDDDQPYLGFYPRRPLYRDKLFSCLAIDAPTLRASIMQRGDGNIPMFGLDASLIRKWRGLEDPLLHFIFVLHKHYPGRLPPVRYPRWPHEFGYDTTHQTADFAFICAKRSLAAFNMLAAVASFMLSLWLSGYEDDCFDVAFYWLTVRDRDYFPRVWLRLLQDSFICNLSAGLRPGGFLNPYTSPWGPYLKFFTRANAPFWLLWGHTLSSYGPTPANTYMRENFFPPIESIELAKQYYKQYSQLVVPEGDPLDVRGVRRSAPARNNEFFFTNLDTMPLPTHHGDAEVGLGIEDFQVETADAFVTNTDPDHPPPPPVSTDRLACVHANSGQKPGESWDSFYVRYMDGLERYKARETAQEKANRLHLEKQNKNGPVGKCKVFEWMQDEVLKTFHRRTLLTKDEGACRWGACTEYQRFYWPQKNQWDICLHLPKYPPGVEVPYVQPYQDLFDTDTDLPDFILKEKPTQLVNKEDKATASMLQAVQDLVVREWEPVDDPSIFPSGSIADYLALRHGFSIETADNWNPELHGAGQLPRTSAAHAVKNLIYVDDKQSLEADATTAIVNFHNVMAAGTPLDKLPPAWDIVSRLKLDVERLRLQYFPSALVAKATVYVLRPPEDSDDKSEWFVALHSATAVLLVYRSKWTTMEEIAKNLLFYQIPFRTVVERQSRPLVKVPLGKPKGLGKRPLNFKPELEDMYAYEDAREDMLQSSYGRAILMQAGVVGRLAYGVVPEYLVLDGPNLVHTEVVCTDGEVDFIDDAVTADELDVVSGVFHVDTDGLAGESRMEAQMSFWPKQPTWCTTGYAGDQWLPPAETWFVTRRRQLVNTDDIDVFNATQWKQKLTKNVKKSRPLFANSEEVAAEFIRRQVG